MDKLDILLRKIDDLREEVLFLKKNWYALHECTEHVKEIEACKKEIRTLNHMLDEQECEIRFLKRSTT